jgi:2-polyprenyl-3-methyl-5-hydroxy-6-metoxy-1,4-benzoquinol methylase
MAEFDYQWKNLPSELIEYNEDRIEKFLNFTKLDPKKYIQNKLCLDAGCGNGRYTYAMLELGAKKVVSYDISKEAVKKCKSINPNTFVKDIMTLELNPIYDFVLSWGVLHHTPNPREAFRRVASQVKKENGIFHVMIYNQATQRRYEEGRQVWKDLSEKERIQYCKTKIEKYGGDLHGWYDAFNPTYNFSYSAKDIKEWFEEEGFQDIKLTTKGNINMRGKYGNFDVDV